MNNIKFKFVKSETAIDNIFIDKYMAKPTSAVFSLVYIYALRNAQANISLSNADIAKHFGLMESEVLKIWQYWAEQNIIKYSDNDIEFLQLSEKTAIDEASTAIEHYQQKEFRLKSVNKPVYNPEDIEKFGKKDENVATLLKNAERLMKKPLSSNDVNTIVSFYDWLGLPIDVIYILLSYAGRHNKSVRYMEKVAIDWSEKNIDSPEKAEDYLNIFLNEYKKIMRAFGITDRSPSEDEQAFMSSWIRTLKMPVDVIKEACKRTIRNTGKASFDYANKILNDWHNEGVSDLGQIKLLDEQFRQKNEKDKKQSTYQNQAVAKPKNSYNDYEQRQYDEKTLEEILKEKTKRLASNNRDN